MNEINDLEFAGYADSDAIFQPLPGTLTPNKENAARFVKLAEKHGGSSDEFICGEVVGKSLDIRGRRIEATICTPVIEDDGEFVGRRHTQAFIADESTAALALLYQQINDDVLVVEKCSGKIVKLLCDL